MLVDVAGFTVFLLLVGTLGPDALAATTLAFNVNTLAFVPMLGLGNRPEHDGGPATRPRPAPTWPPGPPGPRCGWPKSYMGTMAVVYVLLPDVLLMGHAAGTSPANSASFALRPWSCSASWRPIASSTP